MSAINFNRNGLRLLWESVTTNGISLTEAVSSVSREIIKNSSFSSHSHPMQSRRVHFLRSSSPLRLSNVRYDSSLQGGKRDPSFLSIYTSSSSRQKILTLTYNGLRMIGANVPGKMEPSETDVKKAWEEMKGLY